MFSSLVLCVTVLCFLVCVVTSRQIGMSSVVGSRVQLWAAAVNAVHSVLVQAGSTSTFSVFVSLTQRVRSELSRYVWCSMGRIYTFVLWTLWACACQLSWGLVGASLFYFLIFRGICSQLSSALFSTGRYLAAFGRFRKVNVCCFTSTFFRALIGAALIIALLNVREINS